jgi:Uma2 family endonuclease
MIQTIETTETGSPISDTIPEALYAGQKISLDDFMDWEPRVADGWKYEWKDGITTAAEETMNTNQLLIFDAIMRAFAKTEEYASGAVLMPEVRCKFELLNRGRQPDIAYFSRAEMQSAASGDYPIPIFVVEVISTFDNGNELEEKLVDYFAVGVQTVWYVYPKLAMVRVYTSLKQGVYCAGEDICSAAPALPDFQMTARSIFTPSA